MSDQPVRFGIVGAGGIGKTHAGAIAQADGAELCAVADISRDAAESFAKDQSTEAFDDAVAMLDSAKPDAIVICTPPSARIEILSAALERGVAVLMEKPIGHTTESARAVSDLVNASPNAVTGVGFCHRFTPAVLEMRSRVASGDIGRLTRFENVFACSIPGMEDKWFSDPQISGGGSFIDTGCHALDLFRFLVGEAEMVGMVADSPWAGRGEAGATALLRSPASGVAGTILSGWLEPARFLVTLVGTEAMLSYDYEKPTELHRLGVDGSRDVIEVETHDVRFQRQIEAFAKAARGTAHEDMATVEDGLRAAEVIESALHSL